MRRASVVFVLLVVAACNDAPPTAPGGAPDPSAIVIDGTTAGNTHLFFLPPVVDNPNAFFTAPADASLLPRVEICEWEDGSCGGTLFIYTTTTGPGGAVVEVFSDHYQVDWDTQLDGVEVGDVFRARILLFGLELGSVDLQLEDNGKTVKNLDENEPIRLVDNRTLPLRFRIEEGALEELDEEALEDTSPGGACQDEFENVIDCDVEIIDASVGGSAEVNTDPDGVSGDPAARVLIDPDDAVDADGEPVTDFQVTLKHVAAAPSEEFPAAVQIPFFIDLTAVDGNGNPVSFLNGALLIICNPPDLGAEEAEFFVPNELHHSLKIFRVHGGVTEILETGIDEEAGFFCGGGIHGGLNTVLTGFSGFGTVLPTAPSLSTAVVPNGLVDAPTVIDIQAMVESNEHEGPLCDETACEQIFGGDEVVVTITGANGATLMIDAGIADSLDGTYTAQYTPTVAGTDNIDIRIRSPLTRLEDGTTVGGTLDPIFGSPFTSEVGTQVSLWSAEGTFEDFHGRNDGAPEEGGVVTFDDGIVGQAFRFDRDGGVVGGPGNFIDEAQQLSVSAWVNIDEDSEGSPDRAIQRFVTLTGGEKAVIRQNSAQNAGTGRQLHFYMNFGTSESFALQHLTADGVLERGCFNHVVGTYDGSHMRLYLNGVVLRSQAVSGTVVTGDGFHFSNSPTFEGLDGRLDEVAVHNRALAPSDVAALYAAPTSGQCAQPMEDDVVSVDVQPIGPTLSTNTPLQLTATGFDAFGGAAGGLATWSSSDTNIATVDANGMVTGNAPGEATITATIDGVEGITKVTVVDVVIDFETFADGSPVQVGHVTDEWSALGVVFSYETTTGQPGEPRICDSTLLSPAGTNSDHALTWDDQIQVPSGTGCAPATLGEIAMAFSGGPTTVQFKVARPSNGAAATFTATSSIGGNVPVTLLSSDVYTAQNGQSWTEDTYAVSSASGVALVVMSQGAGGAIQLIDDLEFN